MSKTKNSRTRNTAGPKINNLLSSRSRAKSSGMAGSNAEILNEIRSMNQALQQKMQKVGDDVTMIKNNLDSLTSDVAKLGSRTSKAEARICQLVDENSRLANLTQNMDSKITLLEARLEYQENYSRRKNIRIKGVPEATENGQNVTECVKELLRSLFSGTPENMDNIAIERAHRIPTALRRDLPDRGNTGPRHILVRFLKFTDREKVRLRARELRSFQWNGAKVDFFPDFTKEVENKRNKFTEVRCICMKRGLQYSMQYLAVFWVTVGEKRHRFEDAAEAKRCVDNHHPAEEAE
uniref:L1 transposable element RRM domain-containing protein n=1 Tax=Amphiprion percula TaxID=161767 RepID=A0A3P8T5J3_AMPPE